MQIGMTSSSPVPRKVAVTQTDNGFLMRRVADAVEAASEVMFPVNDFGAPDWKTTQMVERTLDYLSELPPQTRQLLMFMFLAIEFASPFLLVGPGRFSRQSFGRRERAMERWRTSWFAPYRMIADALKAQLCMMFLSHRAVQMHMRVWNSCDRPGDVMQLPYRPNAFSETTANGLREDIV
jgi:hypothetical protein